MQESAQRGLCRGALLLLVVLPTLAQAAATAYWSSPIYRAAVRAELVAAIRLACGASAEVREVQKLSPHHWRVAGLTLRHPEKGTGVFFAEELSAQRISGVWVLHAASATCWLDQILAAAPAAHGYTLCRADPPGPMRLKVDAIDIRTGEDSSLAAGSLELQWSVDQGQNCLQTQYRPHSQNDAGMDLELKRTHGAVGPETTLVYRAWKSPLPLQPVLALVPGLTRLGPEANFEGIVVMRSDDSQCKLLIQRGLVRDCRWENLTADLAYRATGRGDVWIHDSVIVDGRIESLAGTLASTTSGGISSQWMRQAEAALKLPVQPGLPPSPGPVRTFTEAEIHFLLDAGGLKLGGGLPKPQENYPMVMIRDGGTPLLYEPLPMQEGDRLVQPVQPIGDLVAWLAADPAAVEASAVQHAGYQSPAVPAAMNPTAAALVSRLPAVR